MAWPQRVPLVAPAHQMLLLRHGCFRSRRNYLVTKITSKKNYLVTKITTPLSSLHVITDSPNT